MTTNTEPDEGGAQSDVLTPPPAQVAASAAPAASGATQGASGSPSAALVLSEAERALVALRALLADGATPGPWLLDGPWWHGRDEAVPLVVTTDRRAIVIEPPASEAAAGANGGRGR